MSNSIKKGKVLHQIEGYRIRQMKDGQRLTGKYGVFAGKYPVNEEKGFATYEEAMELATKLAHGEVTKQPIKKNKR